MKKVLVVDDDEDVREFVDVVLRIQGYETRLAGHGETGMHIVQREHPDLVLIDQRLPGMRGLEMLQRLRERGDKTPAILMSGREVAIPPETASGFLRKPFSSDRLVAAVQELLERAAIRRRR